MENSKEKLLSADFCRWVVFGCAIVGIGAHFLPVFDLSSHEGLLARLGASLDVKVFRIYQAPWAVFTIPLFIFATVYAHVRSVSIYRTFSFIAGMGVILVLGYFTYVYWFYPLEFMASLLGKRNLPKLPEIFTVERIRNLSPDLNFGNYLILGAALMILASSLLAPEDKTSDDTPEQEENSQTPAVIHAEVEKEPLNLD